MLVGPTIYIEVRGVPKLGSNCTKHSPHTAYQRLRVCQLFGHENFALLLNWCPVAVRAIGVCEHEGALQLLVRHRDYGRFLGAIPIKSIALPF